MNAYRVSTWFVVLAASSAAFTGCLREVPGSSCEQSSDCYVGEQCVVNVCVTGTTSMDMRDASSLDMADLDMPDLVVNDDMPRDMPAELDMPRDADMNKIDMSDEGMPDADMSTDPDLDASPDDMPLDAEMGDPDMPVDTPPDMPLIVATGQVVAKGKLPGTRASVIDATMAAPALLAYFPEENEGTLKVYTFDEMQGWVGVEVATQLGWPSTDMSENAAFFDSLVPRIVYEKHEVGGGISIRTAQYNLATRTVYGDEEILPVQSAMRLDFDYVETIAGPNMLVLFSDRAERLGRQLNGSWVVRASYLGSFAQARFVTDAEHTCFRTTDNALTCYSETDPATPEFTETGVNAFETSARFNAADPTKDLAYIVLSRNTGLFFGEMEDRQSGQPNNRGLQWRGMLRGNQLPAGAQISLTENSALLSYQQNSGSTFYSTNANLQTATATPLTYNNPVTSATSQAMTIHIVSSTRASSGIFYEHHGVLP